MVAMLTAVGSILLLVAAGFVWRSLRARAARTDVASNLTGGDLQPEFPTAGLLVPEDVLRTAGSKQAAIWEALEVAAVPIAVEYFPVSDSDLAKYRAVPVNASAQQAIAGMIDVVKPKSQTMFRPVLPEGEKLIKAAGKISGFRGSSRGAGGKFSSSAVWQPVAAGGVIAAGWPLLAVAATVMATDMMAQREQRAYQRRIEASLGRQERSSPLEWCNG
ncbi:hypothetical protein ACFQS1_35135 [Paractinoplanes rhizophilus]|uniref:Uncharacterized protein n=1 Tax=Paractinoplanes rhizophilus TaxID=1416877 RepID=A0ABW2I310_9ACTN